METEAVAESEEEAPSDCFLVRMLLAEGWLIAGSGTGRVLGIQWRLKQSAGMGAVKY